MRRIFASLLLAAAMLLSPLLLVQSVYAVDVLKPACDSASNSTLCRANKSEEHTNNSIYGPNGIITRVAGIIAWIVGVAAVIVIIIAGLQYMLAAGDSAKINNAKNAILYALIGIVVAVSAQAIISFVLRRL